MKIDKFLQDKLSGYDAGFDASAWDAIESQVVENNLANNDLKDHLDDYNAGYSEAAWESISGRVAQGNQVYRIKSIGNKLKGVAAVAGALIIGFLSYPVIIDSDDSNNVYPVVAEKESAIEKSIKPTESEQQNENTTEQVVNEPPSTNTSTKSVTENTSVKTAKALTVAESPKPKETRKPVPHVEQTTKAVAPELLFSNTEVCVGENLDIQLSGKDNNLGIFIDNQLIQGHNKASHRFTKAGKHKVKLVKAVEGKKMDVLAEYTIIANPRAKTDFKYSNEKENGIPVTRLTTRSRNLTQVTWYVAGSKVSNDLSTTYLFTNRGQYQVKVVGQNMHGCIDSSVQTVRILRAYNLLAEQIYNPNKGTWLPIGLKQGDPEFEITVISEKGETVFNTSDNGSGWNGEIPGGKVAQDGDEFYWIAKVKDAAGKTREYGGSFIISSKL